MDQIETPRLLIRRFTPADGRDMAAILTDPEAMYFSTSPVLTRDAALREAADHVTNESLFAVELRSRHRVIGRLYFEDEHFFGAYEIGYLFDRRYWGKGYATEAAQALLRYAFLQLGVRRVTAMADVRNTRSQRVLEKLGMRCEGVFVRSAFFRTDANGDPVWSDFRSYALLREEYLQMTGRG